jgi:hypothetical protein
MWIVNILRQFGENIAVNICVVERNLPIRLKNHSFPDISLDERFSSLLHEKLSLEVCPIMLGTPSAKDTLQIC